MRYVIKRLEIWPAVKMTFIGSLVLGVVLCLLYIMAVSLISGVLSTYTTTELGEDFFRLSGMAGMSIVVMIVLSNAISLTVLVVILVVIYNLVSTLGGGLEIDLQPETIIRAAELPSSPTSLQSPGQSPSTDKQSIR